MKLSEAIRLGSMLKPHGKVNLLTPDGKTCALGAALDAMGCLSFAEDLDDERGTLHYEDILGVQWPILRQFVPWPAELGPHLGNSKCCSIITHLNDLYAWSRERIADWVETVENSASTPVEELDEALV